MIVIICDELKSSSAIFDNLLSVVLLLILLLIIIIICLFSVYIGKCKLTVHTIILSSVRSARYLEYCYLLVINSASFHWKQLYFKNFCFYS